MKHDKKNHCTNSNEVRTSTNCISFTIKNNCTNSNGVGASIDALVLRSNGIPSEILDTVFMTQKFNSRKFTLFNLQPYLLEYNY